LDERLTKLVKIRTLFNGEEKKGEGFKQHNGGFGIFALAKCSFGGD